ncbi:MAG: R3H domain-containing nucleic acid-binding protein [Myxococcales bacterium]
MEPTEEVQAGEAPRGARAKEILAALLGHLGVGAEIEAKEVGEDVSLRVHVTSGAEAVGLADPKAPLWEPIGYLVGKMVNRDPAKRCWVLLQTGTEPVGAVAPPEERDEALVQLGHFLAQRAKALGKVLAVGPMGPRERRSIHLAVKEIAGVTSRSEGEGNSRRLLVVPDQLAASAPADERG